MKQLAFCLLVLLAACQKKNDRNPQLVGNWQGISWLIEGKPSDIVAEQVHFEFQETGDFANGFGNQKSAGKWRTDGDKLYTIADGKAEILVKITKLDADTLRFDMNRGGRMETMTLLRKK